METPVESYKMCVINTQSNNAGKLLLILKIIAVMGPFKELMESFGISGP